MRRRKSRGFTLLELMLVMFIVAILAAGIITRFGPRIRANAFRTRIEHTLSLVRIAANAYYQEHGLWLSLADLVTEGYLERDPSITGQITFASAGSTYSGTVEFGSFNGCSISYDEDAAVGQDQRTAAGAGPYAGFWD